ncbi:MAG: hypothetical protein WCO64_03790 [Actinomycetes bacterium]
MKALWHHIATTSPIPFPSPTGLDVSKVNPGIGGAVTFTLLGVALVLLLISMNRHIKKVNFDEESTQQ